jgi:hypothetical protein
MVVDLVSIMVTSERRAAAARAAGGQQRQRGGGCEGAMQSLLAGRLPFRVVVMIVVDMIIKMISIRRGGDFLFFCQWISFFGLPIKSYSGLRLVVYKKYTLKEPDSRFTAYRAFGVQEHQE